MQGRFFPGFRLNSIIMRPEILNPLFASVDTLKGVGKRRADLLQKLLNSPETEGARILDVLFHLPWQVVDRRLQANIADAEIGGTATLEITVGAHIRPRRKGLPYKVNVFDDSAELTLVFFSPRAEYLAKQLPEGEKRLISGEITEYGGELQMAHPQYIVDPDSKATIPQIEPVYPLTAGLSGKILAPLITESLASVPALPEWIDTSLLNNHGWSSFKVAISELHHPKSISALDPTLAPWNRLAYDELLAGQLALGLVRQRLRRSLGRRRRGDGHLRRQIMDGLSFTLTTSQERSVEEIADDLGRPDRMLRLLQGDVGSGKTIVALLAMAIVVESGAQAVLMAPTEILVQQHFDTLTGFSGKAGIRVAALTGRTKGKSRVSLLDDLKHGKINVLVTTHAGFQDDVLFRELGLAVIDEQHRFGVHQRLALANKGNNADLLVMTATPIPRSLVLAAFGDMDVSRLLEKPAGKKPIDTRILPQSREEELLLRLDVAMQAGARVYWVCPLVEESDLVPANSAEQRYALLKSRFGSRVGLIHGRMKAADKSSVMAAFTAGDIDLLVATTVIEVGVDVPDASIMIVENAERFGLAQLHQLRGRIGRGSVQSSCILLYQGELPKNAEARLSIMRDTEDGFRIAEEDLRLRGEGDLLGTQQSGMPGFRLARLEHHAGLLDIARQDARHILSQDPMLRTERGESLQVLLHLFERGDAIRLLASG
jgi:ATP-dependent DNA helicase RecG